MTSYICRLCVLMSATGMVDATHIFDGLNEFPTHVAHMRLGSFVTNATPWPLPPIDSPLGNNERAPDSTLFRTALQWLGEDRIYRRELEKAGRKSRGARRGQVRIWYDDLGCGYENNVILGCAIKFRGIL
jgi:CCR4-NOT complex subunit CAF16